MKITKNLQKRILEEDQEVFQYTTETMETKTVFTQDFGNDIVGIYTGEMFSDKFSILGFLNRANANFLLFNGVVFQSKLKECIDQDGPFHFVGMLQDEAIKSAGYCMDKIIDTLLDENGAIDYDEVNDLFMSINMNRSDLYDDFQIAGAKEHFSLMLSANPDLTVKSAIQSVFYPSKVELRANKTFKDFCKGATSYFNLDPVLVAKIALLDGKAKTHAESELMNDILNNDSVKLIVCLFALVRAFDQAKMFMEYGFSGDDKKLFNQVKEYTKIKENPQSTEWQYGETLVIHFGDNSVFRLFSSQIDGCFTPMGVVESSGQNNVCVRRLSEITQVKHRNRYIFKR